MKKTVALILAVSMAFMLCACSSSDYKSAVEFFGEEKYEVAKELFEKLGDYKDSKEYVKKCDDIIDYKEANALFSSGKYEEAQVIFEKLGEYEDSKELLKKCETEGKYNLGKKALDEGDWDTAIACFTGLNYLDSEQLLPIAVKEKGMSENADHAFLEDMEKTVLYRMDAARKNTEYSKMVNQELSYVKKYAKETFYDSDLKSIAKLYIEGLELQKNAENAENMFNWQLSWQEGIVKRYKAISDLYNDYGFMNDNSDVKINFVDKYEDQVFYLDAMKSIDSDIQAQTDSGKAYWDANWAQGTLELTLENHRKYYYEAIFDVYFIDSSGNWYDSTTVSATASPGDSFTITVNVPQKERLADIYWEGYYGNIWK